MIYGYCRVSTPRQKPERQESNIKSAFPDAVCVFEKWTGTNLSRPVWKSLQGRLKTGDTVVFDEVSRMSRDAEEGYALYQALFDRGIDLVFLKERHLDTAVYRETQKELIPATGTDVDLILDGINQYVMRLARRQIELAFAGAQKEVDLLHQRTSEGVRRAQIAGKQIGRAQGSTVETKKAKESKKVIKAKSRDFGGSWTDEELMKYLGVSRNSFYKYKRELKETK